MAAKTISVELLQEVRTQLESTSDSYRRQADKQRRPKEFFIGDLVMVHLSKGRTPVGTYSKLQDKKI